MAYSLQAAQVEDAGAVTDIFQQAFGKDEIMGYLNLNVPAKIQREKDIEFFRGLIEEGDVYGARFTKVVDNKTGYGLLSRRPPH